MLTFTQSTRYLASNSEDLAAENAFTAKSEAVAFDNEFMPNAAEIDYLTEFENDFSES